MGSVRYFMLVLVGTIVFLPQSQSAISNKDKNLDVKIQPVLVRSKKVQVQAHKRSVLVPSRLQARVDARLSSEVEGYVTKVVKNLGDTVKSGEVILFVKHLSGQYNHYAVRSPVDGQVSTLNIYVGKYISKGEILAQVVQNSSIYIYAEVPADDLLEIQKGFKAELTVHKKKVEAEVTAVSPVVDSMTGTGRVELRPLTNKESLRSGMIGQLKIHLPAVEAIAVPISAIKRGTEHITVDTIKNDQVLSKEITLGEVLGEKQVVLSGLKNNDEIILFASDYVKDGDPVQRQKKQNSTKQM